MRPARLASALAWPSAQRARFAEPLPSPGCDKNGCAGLTRQRRPIAREEGSKRVVVGLLLSFLSIHLVLYYLESSLPSLCTSLHSLSLYSLAIEPKRSVSHLRAARCSSTKPHTSDSELTAFPSHALKHPPPPFLHFPYTCNPLFPPFARLSQKHSAPSALHCKSTGPASLAPIAHAHHVRGCSARLAPEPVTDPPFRLFSPCGSTDHSYRPHHVPTHSVMRTHRYACAGPWRVRVLHARGPLSRLPREHRHGPRE